MITHKILITLSILVFISQAIFSQEEYLIDTDNMFTFRNVRIDENGDYVSIFNQDSSNYHYTGGIVKFNKDFEYDIYLHNIDTAYVEFCDFVVTDNNQYLISGTIGSDIGLGISNHIIYFLLMDNDFTIINDTFFPLPEQYTNPFIKILKNTDGRIYVTIERGDPTGALKGVIELSSSAQIVNEKMYYNLGGGIMNPFPSNGNGFFLLRNNPVPWAAGEITEVDTNLNFTSNILPYYINGQFYDMGPRGSCKWLNDSTYILCSQGSLESDTKDLYIYKLNSEHEFLTEPFIIGRENIDDIAVNFQGINWTDPESIFVAGNVWASMYYQTTYYVAIINEDFELLGAKSYGGDNNTFVNSILSTPDGGCVMVGGQRDYLAGNEFDGDGYVVFFQHDDIITSANETSNPYDSDYLLNPNPGQDELYIQTARKGVRLKMYDQAGKLVLTYKFSNDFRNQIKTMLLKPGLYVCRLTDKDGNIEHKKWIKQ
nr:T9SS type A sorting domain-containing protein [Bacteroidota bacterium]